MKSTCLVLLIILSISSVSALTINAESESNVIVPEINHPAKFNLTITGAEEGSYTIYTLTDVEIKPKSPFQLYPRINNIEIFVYPRAQLSERGLYVFNYNIGETQDKLIVNIVDLEDLIEISSDSIDPLSNQVTFYVENKENAVVNNLKAKFTSIIFDSEQEFNLQPSGRTEITVNVDSDKLRKTRAGTYIVKGEFETADGTKTISGKIYIGEKKNIITEEDGSGFLIRTKTITKINAGNVNENVKIIIKKNIISRLFNSFNTEPTSVERSSLGITYEWNKQLGPSETLAVKTSTNYIFPLLIIIAAIVIIYGFRRFIQTKIEIRKSVSPIRTKGGEFALKVKLIVKARKTIENVSLIDRIPRMVKIYKKFGTLKPDKIDAENRRIQWDIGDLNAGEERIFSYIVYSKIGVVGKFTLPAALAVFETIGEIHEVESNKVFFLSEQTDRDD
tara:strand:- start:381 stop:1727 length:1347 start_codon:yes stop_codon:yes gene_type:complete